MRHVSLNRLFLAATITLGCASAAAYEVDSSEYFSYSRDQFNNALLLSNKLCQVTKEQAAMHQAAALEVCERTGGHGCRMSKGQWKSGKRVHERERILVPFCWQDLHGIANGNPVTVVAVCQFGSYGNPQHKSNCSLPLKQSFKSTANLPRTSGQR